MNIRNSYKATGLPCVPYVYFIQHIPTGIWYIGSKYAVSAHPSLFLINYFTSSTLFRSILKISNMTEIKYKILKTFITAEDALKYEQRLLIKLKAVQNSMSMNMDDRQEPSKTIQNKMKTKFISNVEEDTCIRVKYDVISPSGWINGNIHHKGAYNKNKRQWFYDPLTLVAQHLNPETDSTEGLLRGRGANYKSNSESIKSKNLMWITDKNTNKLIEKNSTIPDGYVKGRTKSEQEKEECNRCNVKRIGMKYYNDGVITRQFKINEVPEGFILGHLTLKNKKASKIEQQQK